MELHLAPSGLARIASLADPDLLIVTHVYPPTRPADAALLCAQNGFGGNVVTGEGAVHLSRVFTLGAVLFSSDPVLHPYHIVHQEPIAAARERGVGRNVIPAPVNVPWPCFGWRQFGGGASTESSTGSSTESSTGSSTHAVDKLRRFWIMTRIRSPGYAYRKGVT